MLNLHLRQSEDAWFMGMIANTAHTLFRVIGWCLLLVGYWVYATACTTDAHNHGGEDFGADEVTGMPSLDEPAASLAPMPVGTPTAQRFEESGPWSIGFRETEIEYSTPRGDVRKMRLLLWYPVDGASNSSVEAAFVGGLVIRSDIYVEGNPPSDNLFPLLVFSHGSQGLAEQSFYLSEHFASHGWIVVAPDHTGNTLYSGDGPLHTYNYIRPQDIKAVIDHTLSLPDDHVLHGHVDETVVVAGHSFGAYTALALGGAVFDPAQLDHCGPERTINELCVPEAVEDFRAGFRDPRISAAVAMTPIGLDAYLVGEGSLSSIDIPTFVITAGRDQILPPASNGDRVWASLKRPQHLRMNFPNAGHFSFTNLCEGLPREIIPDRIFNDGCADQFTPTKDVHTVTKAYALAFIRARLFQDETALSYLIDKAYLRGVASLSEGGTSEK